VAGGTVRAVRVIVGIILSLLAAVFLLMGAGLTWQSFDAAGLDSSP